MRCVLVLLEAEFGPRLLGVRGLGRVLDGVEAHALTSFLRIEVKNPRPSVRPVPISGSTACSGCGMRPTTLPAALVMPAMSRSEPLGLHVQVAEGDPALGLQLVEDALVGDIAAVDVLQRDGDLLARGVVRRSRRSPRSPPAASGRGR